MTSRRLRRSYVAVLPFLAYLLAAPVAAQDPGCTAMITSVPALILSPGIHCLAGDLSSSFQTAIAVLGEDITIDLRGFTLSGPDDPASVSSGVSADRRNVTVRNGTIRGFGQGVVLAWPFTFFGGTYVVENVRAEGNFNIGIRVSGQNSVRALVRDNVVLQTGGSTRTTPTCNGIEVFGLTASVTGNVVTGLAACDQGGQRTGILVTSNGGVVERNQVGNESSLPNSEGIQVSGDVLVVDNRVSRFSTGFVMNTGARFRDNLTATCFTRFSGGTDLGNNQ